MVANWLVAFVLAGTILAIVMTPVLSTIVSGALVLVPLLAPTMTVFGLVAIGWLRVKNPAITGDDLYSIEIGWLVVLAALVGCLLLASRRRLPEYLVWFWAFIALAMSTAPFASLVLSISLMKAAMLLIGVTTVFIAASTLGQRADSAVRVAQILEISYLAITLASLPLLAWPDVGFALNGTGFQSFVNQPQAFAVIYSPLVAWYVVFALVDRHRAGLQGLLLAVVGIAIVFATDSRTGLVSVIIGVLFAVLSGVSRGGKAATQSMMLLVGIVLVVALILWLLGGAALDWLVAFVLKWEEGSELSVESALSTRALLLQLGWTNFLQNPILGIGFGMPSMPSALNVATLGPMGIPLSVPIEKGNGFLQVLEETGIVGAAVLLVFFVKFAKASVRTGSVSMVALWAGALAVNVGEAVLLSIGGVGLVTWLYMVLATIGTAAEGRRGWLLAWRAV